MIDSSKHQNYQTRTNQVQSRAGWQNQVTAGRYRYLLYQTRLYCCRPWASECPDVKITNTA